MAAIVQPHRLAAADRRGSDRPDLRLVHGGARVRPAPSPVLVVALVVVALLVAAVGAVAVGRGALAGLAPAPVGAGPAPAAADAGADVVVVQPGDTLWTIARRMAPSGDIRPLVDRLEAANGGTALQPGQELIVPG